MRPGRRWRARDVLLQLGHDLGERQRSSCRTVGAAAARAGSSTGGDGTTMSTRPQTRGPRQACQARGIRPDDRALSRSPNERRSGPACSRRTASSTRRANRRWLQDVRPADSVALLESLTRHQIRRGATASATARSPRSPSRRSVSRRRARSARGNQSTGRGAEEGHVLARQRAAAVTAWTRCDGAARRPEHRRPKGGGLRSVAEP